eukprot:TRINITY_DN4931_c0_g2_i2.p1 TRINITY_DN4931_c0_g2~~TRINITY_DN4931_c0_g2_i2.p1  ORF type:complete len:106 (+),score=4.77 TRINITY_DN4931_c0_g2_i2:283-600(+)
MQAWYMQCGQKDRLTHQRSSCDYYSASTAAPAAAVGGWHCSFRSVHFQQGAWLAELCDKDTLNTTVLHSVERCCLLLPQYMPPPMYSALILVSYTHLTLPTIYSV